MIDQKYYVRMAKERTEAVMLFFARAGKFPPNVDEIRVEVLYDDGSSLDVEITQRDKPKVSFWKRLIGSICHPFVKPTVEIEVEEEGRQ